jgi:hypothetical protein
MGGVGEMKVFIITRDPKGFKDFDLLVMSPSQFIDRCTVGEVK